MYLAHPNVMPDGTSRKGHNVKSHGRLEYVHVALDGARDVKLSGAPGLHRGPGEAQPETNA